MVRKYELVFHDGSRTGKKHYIRLEVEPRLGTQIFYDGEYWVAEIPGALKARPTMLNRRDRFDILNLRLRRDDDSRLIMPLRDIVKKDNKTRHQGRLG